MLTGIDIAVLVLYLIAVAAFGIRLRGDQRSTDDYFLGGRDLPWWAVCFSIVATETSTLTVIGIPAVAYGGSLVFFQLTFGYLAGRIIVAWLLLPRYSEGSLVTAYDLLGQRFGATTRRAASGTFLLTRLLADGVRLFATAIPIRVILATAGYDVGYGVIIAAIAVVTIAYTYVGGLRSVVWMDVVQMGLYVGGGVLAVILLWDSATPEAWQAATDSGKLRWLDVDAGWVDILTSPYALVTATVGGAVFSMASHGTDHLIVQRLLACRTLNEGRKALVGSAILVMAQFALFLAVGLLLWMHYEGRTIAELGLSRGDEIFPRYIIEGMPQGISGLLLAGIVAAAMSTLSSSLNALASSTVSDLFPRLSGLRNARRATLVWGLVFIGFAMLFQDQSNPVVELGLAIASFTYGGLLGVFLLGLVNPRVRDSDAAIALIFSVLCMVLIIFGVWHSADDGWVFVLRPDDARVAADGLRALAWPWYTTVGTAITLAAGSLLALRHRRSDGPVQA